MQRDRGRQVLAVHLFYAPYITAASSNVCSGTSGNQATGGGGTPFTTPPDTFTLEDAATAAAAIRTGAGPH